MPNLKEFLDMLNEELNEAVDVRKIKVKHPGILEIPEDKHFWDMPLSHYKRLMKEKGRAAIMKALLNLERWNHNNHPAISARARKLINALKEE